METLKVTTLTLLIAFTWLTSEVAAYPQKIVEMDVADNNGTALNCGRSWTGHPKFREQDGNQLDLSETVLGLIAPPNTSSHHTGRNTRHDVCSFDFGRNKSRSSEVAR